MVEWFKAPVLKTGVLLYSTMGSNPVLSVTYLLIMKYTKYRSVTSLRKGLNQQAGRNSDGHITVRHRGGGHKQTFRSID